jgi:hypothetical protein
METRPETSKINGWGLIFKFFCKCFLTMSATGLKLIFLGLLKNKVILNCSYIHFNRPRKIFWIFFNFYSVSKWFCVLKHYYILLSATTLKIFKSCWQQHLKFKHSCQQCLKISQFCLV